MAHTALTAGVNVVRYGLMTPAEFAATGLNPNIYGRMKRLLQCAKKGSYVHRGALLCSIAIDPQLRERSRVWLERV